MHLSKQLAHDLDLGAREPPRHARDFVTASFGEIGFQALVCAPHREERMGNDDVLGSSGIFFETRDRTAHERNGDVLEHGVAKIVDEGHHAAVVITGVEQRRDAQEHARPHAQQRDHHLVDEALVAVRRLLQDDHFARNALETLFFWLSKKRGRRLRPY